MAILSSIPPSGIASPISRQGRTLVFAFGLLRRAVTEGFRHPHNSEEPASFPKQPEQSASANSAHISPAENKPLLDRECQRGKPASPEGRSFILQVSDFVTVRLLEKQEAFRVLKRTLNFAPEKIEAAQLKHDTFLDYYLPESAVECHRGHLRVDDYYVKV
jgi:hypothetical protein